MARVLSSVLLIALFASLHAGANAQTSAAPVAQSTLARIRQTQTIRLAYRVDAAPFSYQSGTAAPIGYMIELCKAVAKALPQIANLPALTVTYVPVTAVNRFDAIKQGRADLLCDSSTATLDRRKAVDFSIPTFVDGASVLVRNTKIANFSELAGKKIAVVSGTTTQQALDSTIKAANISASVVPAATYLDGLHMLDSGAVSALFGDRSVLLYLIPQSAAPSQLYLADNYLTAEPYAMAMQRGDTDFRLAVDTALSHIYRSGLVVPIYAATFGRQTIDPTLVLFYAASSLPD
jgi:ABC-type amino acid transport substrate-binding protein